MPVAVIDGSTIIGKLPYAQNELFFSRCQIWRPDRIIVRDGIARGNLDTVDWDMLHDNWPFYHKQAYGLDQPFLVGRQDQDLVFTTERLEFPIDTQIDQDHVIRDISLRFDGTKARNFGRYFFSRGNPSWFEQMFPPDGGEPIGEPWLIVMCSMEARAPRKIAEQVATFVE